jgi:hexosaminidase
MTRADAAGPVPPPVALRGTDAPPLRLGPDEAVAEIAWSRPAGADRTWASFRERVGALAPLWRAAGIRFHRSAGVPWREGP